PIGASRDQNIANTNDDFSNLGLSQPGGSGVTPPPIVTTAPEERAPVVEDTNKKTPEKIVDAPVVSSLAKPKNTHTMTIIDDPNKPAKIQKFDLSGDREGSDFKGTRVTQ